MQCGMLLVATVFICTINCFCVSELHCLLSSLQQYIYHSFLHYKIVKFMVTFTMYYHIVKVEISSLLQCQVSS